MHSTFICHYFISFNMHLCTRPKSMQWISSDIPHTPRVHRAEVHLHLHRHHYHHHHHHRGTGSFIVNGFWRQFWWIERSVQPAPTAGLRKAPKDELGPCGSTLGHRFPCRRSRHRAELYTLLTRKVGPRVWARRVWYSGCVSEWTVWKSAYRVYVYSRDPYTHTHRQQQHLEMWKIFKLRLPITGKIEQKTS